MQYLGDPGHSKEWTFGPSTGRLDGLCLIGDWPF
jgi:hypothetical protein